MRTEGVHTMAGQVRYSVTDIEWSEYNNPQTIGLYKQLTIDTLIQSLHNNSE